ncbi:hypothetical protein WJX82_002528 [Trebouxia sp. C0006]
MSNLELLVPAVGQLISVTRGDHDQSVLSDTDTLRQQRLSDRDKHHHKQLWTKHPHGGQYRKVVSAKKTEVTLQTIEPGYEKPKSGPTTNFVGNHMTQGCVHLPQDAQAASCPSESGTMSQSESVQMTPVTAADGMLTSPGDEAVLLQHHTFNFEDLKSEAEAEARRGAYQDAVLSYTVMLQRLGTVSNTEKAHIHCCLAGCLMQTGQLKLAVEECNGAVACAQGLADVSMLVSALRQRAMVYQQLEAYHLSLQDFCCILQLQPGNIAAQQARCRLRMLVELQF